MPLVLCTYLILCISQKCHRMLEPEGNLEITPFNLVWRRKPRLRGGEGSAQSHQGQGCIIQSCTAGMFTPASLPSLASRPVLSPTTGLVVMTSSVPWTSLFLPLGIPALPANIHPVPLIVQDLPPHPQKTPSPCGPLSPIHAAGHPFLWTPLYLASTVLMRLLWKQ